MQALRAEAILVIIVRRAGEYGSTVGFECGPDVRCTDCNIQLEGLVWIAERLVGMHHTEPVVELLCLRCARAAKLEIRKGSVTKDDDD